MLSTGAAILFLLLASEYTVAFIPFTPPSLLPVYQQSICRSIQQSFRLQLRAESDGEEEDEEFDEDFQDLVDGKVNKRFRKPSKKKSRKMDKDDVPVLFNGLNKWEVFNKAIFAGIFVAGIGTGITIDSAINTNPKDLASRDGK